MIFLGFGKYARADKIYALEPIDTADRGSGRRTRVWVEGVAEPIVASRTERTILHEMGHDPAPSSAIIDDALGLAERLPRRPTRARSTSATSAAARSVCSRRRRAPATQKLF